ncbi:MAG: glycosyltransferase family 9 protein [Deltaproteobacteria bacterium]|nr:glycosyltransferase family 9 protein [Deltaproteobacteria bacterium]
MINYFIKHRLKQQQFRNREITPEEFDAAGNILFSVFSRYGDGIIAFKIINEFIARFPEKTYFLLTSHQLRPYAEALVDGRVQVGSVRKRNPVQLVKTIKRLKDADIDVGLNPWGSRGESEFFLTFGKRFYTFSSIKFKITDNLYFRVRRYLGLPEPEERETGFALSEPVRRVLLSPFSSDVRKSVPPADVVPLLSWLDRRFPEARVTIALGQEEADRVKDAAAQSLFIFGKSEPSSRQFLELLKESDLFVGVDAGPLHLADALGKPCIGLFGPTPPETIMDAKSHILALRSEKLQGIFCAVQSCPMPHCLRALFQDDPEAHISTCSQGLKEERGLCRFLHPEGG